MIYKWAIFHSSVSLPLVRVEKALFVITDAKVRILQALTNVGWSEIFAEKVADAGRRGLRSWGDGAISQLRHGAMGLVKWLE